MADTIDMIVHSILIGTGATAAMDVWLTILQRLGVPTLNFALLGRWIGYIPRGRWFHRGIAKSDPINHELVIGWIAHYSIGICFAVLLTLIAGPLWLHNPSLLPAIATGLITAAAPLFVMQPAMGSGFASSKTRAPIRNCVKSVMNHLVFGCGLYFAAVMLARWL